MGTRADFYIGTGPNAVWLGSTSYDGYPDGWGKGPLAASSEDEFRAAVEHMLTHAELATRPTEGWPWPWPDSRITDYAYAWDPTNGAMVSVFGRKYAKDEATSYDGRKLRDDEVVDMRKVPNGDILGKSGLVFLKTS
jgi:hypothetical protein